MASILDGDKRIDLFPRDVDALRRDPPRVEFMVRGSGIGKFEEFRRTGQRQQFGPDEVSNLRTTLSFLLPDVEFSGSSVVLDSAIPDPEKRLKLRVVFSKGSDSVRYELIEFRTISLGGEQVVIESASPLPFVLRFTLPMVRGGKGVFRIQKRFHGAGLAPVGKALRAMACLRGSGEVELFALELEKPIVILRAGCRVPPRQQLWEDAVIAAAQIAELYKVALPLPTSVARSDRRAIAILSDLARGGLAVEGLKAKLIKSREAEGVVLAYASQEMRLVAHLPGLEPTPEVFGTKVATGPISIVAERASVLDPGTFVEEYKAAAYGEAVRIGFAATQARAQLGHVPPNEAVAISAGDMPSAAAIPRRHTQ